MRRRTKGNAENRTTLGILWHMPTVFKARALDNQIHNSGERCRIRDLGRFRIVGFGHLFIRVLRAYASGRSDGFRSERPDVMQLESLFDPHSERALI
jgi:hypothetical protein